MKHTLLNFHHKRKSVIAIALAICVYASALGFHIGNVAAQETYAAGLLPTGTQPSVSLTLNGFGSVISGKSGTMSIGVYVNNLSSSTRITSILYNGEALKFEHNVAWLSVNFNSSIVGTQSMIVKANSIKVVLSAGIPLYAPSKDISIPYIVLKKNDSLSNTRYVTKLTSSATPECYRVCCTTSGTTQITKLDSTLQTIDSTTYTITGTLSGYELGFGVDSGQFATWDTAKSGTKSTTSNPVGTAANFTALLSPADTTLPATGGLVNFNASFTSTGAFSVAPHVDSWSLQKTAPVAQSMPAPLGSIDTVRSISFLTSGSYLLTVTMFATDISGTIMQDTASATVTVSAGAMYTLARTALPAVGGTIGASPNQVSYTQNTVVTLSATPSAGYTFSHWSGDASGVAPTASVTMNSNKSVTAVFTAIVIPPTNYQLSTTSSPAEGGSISKSPDATSYIDGTAVTVTATPAAGYTFSGWSGDASGVATSATVVMNANKTVTATFIATPKYVLTVQASPAAGGYAVKTPNVSSYDSGTSVVVTANANAGYTFIGWAGDASGTNSSATVTMDSNKSVTANFASSGHWETVIDVPGHYDTVVDVPGHNVTSQVWHDPVTTTVPGYWTSTTTPGYYTTEVDVAGHYNTVVDVPGHNVTSQVWHDPVTTTVPGYWTSTTTPGYYTTEVDVAAHTDTVPGYYTTEVDVAGYTETVTTPGWTETVTTPGWTETVTTPGYTETIHHPNTWEVDVPGYNEHIPGWTETVATWVTPPGSPGQGTWQYSYVWHPAYDVWHPTTYVSVSHPDTYVWHPATTSYVWHPATQSYVWHPATQSYVWHPTTYKQVWHNPVSTYYPATYKQVWHDPVTTSVWHAPVSTTVPGYYTTVTTWVDTTYKQVWVDTTYKQVWHDPVTTPVWNAPVSTTVPGYYTTVTTWVDTTYKQVWVDTTYKQVWVP